MEKKMNNKGFSLVELIIVIAIMAVLVGILAPQYLKYVHNSEVSTDISNAQAMASAINVAVADGDEPFDAAGTAITWANVDSLDGEATSRLGGTWGYSGDNTSGVDQITLTVGGTTYEAYPNPDATNGLNDLRE